MTLYSQLPSEQQFYWAVALFASAVFLVQMALTFIGIGDVDANVDFSLDADAMAGDTLDMGGALQLFSVRNIVNFLLGFGWGGVCFRSLISNNILLGIVAFITGAVFVVLFMYILKQMFRLESNGAFQIKDSVGQICDVYLRIPANESGKGKVQISFSGSVQEIDALTAGEAIPSGTKVRVLRLVDNHSVMVEKA